MVPDAPFSRWSAPSVAPSSAPELHDVNVIKPKRVRGPTVERTPVMVDSEREHQNREPNNLESQHASKSQVHQSPFSGPPVSSLAEKRLFPADRSQCKSGHVSSQGVDNFQSGNLKVTPLAQQLMLVRTSNSTDSIKVDSRSSLSGVQEVSGLGISDMSGGSGVGVSQIQKVPGEEAVKRWQLHEQLPTFAKEMIAGGVAGAIAKTSVAPLERVKILFQTNLGDFHRAGVGGSLRRIYQTEGLHGFLKGNGATVLRVVPYAALHFMSYEQYRRWLVEATGHSTPSVDLIAGSLSGATAVYFTYPLDLIRTRLAWHVSGPSSAVPAVKGAASVDNIRGVFLEIVRKEGGFRGLYKGIGPTLYGILPYAGLKFYIYEMMKLALVRATDEQPTLPTKLGCGGVAGIIGQTLTYPLDVVRRQMQVQGAPADVAPRGAANALPAHRYKDTWDGLRTIVRTQGWRQLYAGLSINYLKMVPSVAIGFTVYDAMKAWLRVPPREKGSRKAGAVT